MQSEVNQEENLNRIITVPNLLSFFRLCLIPVIIWSYCVKKNPLLAGEILLLSGLTDLADGYIARRFHRISNLGKILDPVADKLTQAAMLICLFTRFPHVLLLIVIMAGKELYMVVSGLSDSAVAFYTPLIQAVKVAVQQNIFAEGLLVHTLADNADLQPAVRRHTHIHLAEQVKDFCFIVLIAHCKVDVRHLSLIHI